MANKVLAVAFGAPFGIAGRPCFSKQLTASYLPLLGQYGKRIRTSKALGGLRVEGLFDYLTGGRASDVSKPLVYTISKLLSRNRRYTSQ